MDNTIVSSIIGGVALVGSNIATSVITKNHTNRKSDEHYHAPANFEHRQRNYNKTQILIEKELYLYKKNNQIPDLYITNFGTPISKLENCQGYSDYQNFLIQLTERQKCTIKRYFVLTDEKKLSQHINHIVKRSSGHSHAHIYCSKSSPLGSFGDNILNFIALGDSFAAITFENEAKIVLSMHTKIPHEVTALSDIIRGVEKHSDTILEFGKKREIIGSI